MSENTTYLCPQCQIGHLQTGKQTYVRVVNGMVVSLPNTSAFTCDVCGYQEFDQSALAHVDALIGASHQTASEYRQPVKPTPVDGKTAHGLKRS